MEDWADGHGGVPGGHGGVQMGLRPIPTAQWFQVPEDVVDRLAAKRELYRQRFTDVVGQLPEAAGASQELLEIVAGRFDGDNPSRLPAIAAAGLKVADDVAIMQPSDQGYRLTAASICAPSSWWLHAKLGEPMSRIHAPVPHLEDRIGTRIAHFLERLPVDRVFERRNWHFYWSADPYQPPGCRAAERPEKLTAETVATGWIRTERQTFRRLNRSGAIVFTILVGSTSLDEIGRDPQRARGLVAAFERLSPEDRAYRGWAELAGPLREWAAGT